MPGHQTEYRGYRIKAERDGRAWRVAVSPKHPDLPLMRKPSFEIPATSVDEAVSTSALGSIYSWTFCDRGKAAASAGGDDGRSSSERHAGI